MKALLFDLGNVLVSFDHRKAARALAPFTDKTPDEIYRLFFDSDITGQFEEGKISPVDFFLKVRDSLGARIVFEAFVPIWNDIFFMTQENHSLHAFIVALGKKYTVALLSNINVLHFEYLRVRFPVFSPFDRLFLSYQMDARKPDPLLYRTVLATLGTRPDECFYTDDREDLVTAARGLGIRAFVYRGLEQLKSDLREEGIDDP